MATPLHNGVNGSGPEETLTNGHIEQPNAANGAACSTPPSPVPIAIVGMSCRFAGGASSPSKLWDLCVNAQSGWSEIPESRFDVRSLYHPDRERPGRTHVIGGHFLEEDVSLFDAAFFSFSADVAAAMDPQVRLLLEAVYEATENAGIPIEKLAGSNTSVFSGTYSKDFNDLSTSDVETLPVSFLTGTGTAMLSNRISHFYDLQGPSMTVDTGCSSGLTALHLGVSSIRSGDASISVVGASNTLLSPELFIAGSTQSMLGRDGKCYAWDSRAEGYGRGEGTAALILKPLDAALRDGDNIQAVIREIVLNQDGKTTTITSPSATAQEELIKECYKRAGLDIADTAYVEAHMTGTPSGDPIEAEALARTFGKARAPGSPAIVGSVKTNIGHTEPVSGLAAIIKSIHVLQNRAIPPNLNYQTTNPKIPLKDWNLTVPTDVIKLPDTYPLRVSVNNFGYGGTNAHLILEDAPSRPLETKSINGHSDGNFSTSPDQDDLSRVFFLSAKDAGVARTLGLNLASHARQSLENGKPLNINDLAYTLHQRRSKLPWRVAVTASSLAELATNLENPSLKAIQTAKVPRIAFVFNGQGAQWHAMGRELIDHYPVFSTAIRNADAILKEYGASWSLHEELMRDAKSTRVHHTNISQPISVAIQLCLVDLLKSWGISPSAVTSHSSGEIAAAYTVGVLSFKEALGVVYYRGELAMKYQTLASLDGAMLAAGLSAEKAEAYLSNLESGRVVVACVNSPDSVTLSGDSLAINEVEARLTGDGVFARKLKVPLAYHSHHMMLMAEDYTTSLTKILPQDRQWDEGVLYSSPVSGKIVASPASLTPDHWVRNLTSPVLFSQSFENMCFDRTSDADSPPAQRIDLVVEIGAHSTLSGPIRQILASQNPSVTMPYTSCLKRNTDAVLTMQELAGYLVCRGYPVDLTEVNFPFGQGERNFIASLPSYPWNHSSSYWAESRVNRENRFRKYTPHELIGTPMPGSTTLSPTWRNFLRLNDIPWLADHRLDSKVVLPGAGYMAMAIEAVRTVVDVSEETISGYSLREVDIASALTIPEGSSGVETQLCLRRCGEKELDHDNWYSFELASLGDGGSWIQHCTGFVCANLTAATESSPEWVKESTKALTKTYNSNDHFSGSGRPQAVGVDDIFAGLRGMTFYHGPMFQNLVDSRICGTKGITTLNVAPCASETDREYAIHPTTLDSIIVAAYSALTSNMRDGTMVVPRAIGALSIPKAFPRRSGNSLRAFTEVLKQNKRGMTSDVVVVPADENGAQSNALRIDGFFCQSIPQGQNSSAKRDPVMCFKTRWVPDMPDALRSTAVQNAMKIRLNPQEVDFEKKIIRASYYMIEDAIRELTDAGTNVMSPDQVKILDWMKAVASKVQAGELAPGCRAWPRTSKGLRQILLDEVSTINVAGKTTFRLGRQLSKIIRGEASASDVMKEDNFLQNYLQESPRQVRSYHQLGELLRLYAVQHPDAKILEVGSATGHATQPILEALKASDTGAELLCAKYELTKPSSEALETAKQSLAAWSSLVDFRTLDLGTTPVDQGFTASDYDLILIPYTAPQRDTLASFLDHVRSLLKQGGKVILIDTSRLSLDTQLVFSTLPGRWPTDNTIIPLRDWDSLLKAANFTGVEFELGDCEESQYRSSSIIISSASKQPVFPAEVTILYAGSVPPEAWLSSLRREIYESLGTTVTSVQRLQDTDTKANSVYIFIAEMEEPLLDNIDSTTFNRLREVLLNSAGLLWLSCGSLAASGNPKFGMTQGLLRTMREEDASKRIVHLDFEQQENTWSDEKRKYVLTVLQQSFDESVDLVNTEREYAVKDSILHVLRVSIDEGEENATASNPIDPEAEMLPWYHPGRDWVYEIDPAGVLSNIHFVDNPAIAGDVPDGYIEIEPKTFGLNFRDVMTSLGQLDETLIGNECSGVVTRLGPGTADSGLHVGDRVCAIADNRFGSKVFSRWSSAAKIPDAMSFEEAATIPYIWSTAYHGLVDIARIEKGESILIHSATGGVGQATLMLARHLDAEVFATCSSQAKRDFLIETYGLAPDHIFSSRDTSFAAGIRAMTPGGRGVDVVMNHLAGPLLKATWECLAPFGRFVEIGKVDMEAARRLDMTPLTRCASIYGIDILQLAKHKGRVVRRALDASIHLWEQRAVGVVGPITRYSISDMEKAMRAMQGGTHKGKIVLVPQPDDQIKVVSRPQPVRFAGARAQDATYLVVGGLGGIGRTIAIWLAERGAKHVLLVSRNAESHVDAPELKREAKKLDCDLHIRNCDVANEDSLRALLKSCAGVIPPVRGVIHAAMLLQDAVLERMTYEQWFRGVSPKVAGAWNIHNCVPDLNFFVMLSSLVGISGHMSQANYAAGNTFLDALARHRTAQGLPAVSLDLGGVKSVGFVAESEDDVLGRVIRLGSIPMEIERVLRLIESGIRVPLRASVDDAQVVTSIDSWDNLADASPIKRDLRFRTLQAVARVSGLDNSKLPGQANSDMLLTQTLSAATVTMTEAAEVIITAITDKLAKIFSLAASEIDASLSMSHYGVDSLVAVELRNWLSSSVKAKLSIFEILQSSSLAAFASTVASKSEFMKGLVQ
ncbi:hypothetical protein EKO27_g6114 [Xylaria grammica]|uniref:Uncharacterized protein n=1 Tax=Xylaria grammica TaxID=363999 RepID=A0A439D3P0_9PEZI|nr:hypothetical protein EKO27_g6114 [Xylaria grammica]